MLSTTRRSDSADDDLLYRPHYESYILEFCKITNAPEFYLRDISSLVELLKESNIVSVLMCEPRNTDAITCVKNYLDSKPQLPQSFLTRLLALSNTKIRLTPARFGASSPDSYVAKVIPGNTQPMTKMTEMTVRTMSEALSRDIQYNRKVYSLTNGGVRNVPNAVKIKFTPTLMSQLVRAQVDLYRTIEEANRRNYIKISPYIQSRAASTSTSTLLR